MPANQTVCMFAICECPVFVTHVGGQKQLQRGGGDVGEVLHKVPGGAEHAQHLLVGARDELEAAHRGQTLHVVAVDLGAADLMPGGL